MNELYIGDKVYMLANPYVPIGTIGTIVSKDYSMILCEVLFDDGRRFWVPASCVKRADTSMSQSSKRELRIGDKVRIKSREWYEANKNKHGTVNCKYGFVDDMAVFCGRSFKIKNIMLKGGYRLDGAGDWTFSDEMFEEDAKDSTDTIPTIFERCREAVTSMLSSGSIPISVGLIRSKKLLTNIKLD